MNRTVDPTLPDNPLYRNFVRAGSGLGQYHKKSFDSDSDDDTAIKDKKKKKREKNEKKEKNEKEQVDVDAPAEEEGEEADAKKNKVISTHTFANHRFVTKFLATNRRRRRGSGE